MASPFSGFLEKFPDKVTVNCTIAHGCALPDLGRKRFIVPRTMELAEFKEHVLRDFKENSAAASAPSQQLSFFVGGSPVELDSLIGELHQLHKGDDGTLLVTISEEEFTVQDAFLPLSAHVQNLLKDTESADVTFLAGGEKVMAHRMMLVRVPYFKSMLCGGFAEAVSCEAGGGGKSDSRTTTVEVGEIDAPTLRRVLHFVYTDDPESAAKDLEAGPAMSLGRASDMYGLMRLRRAAERALERCVKAGLPHGSADAVGILQYAKRYDCRLIRRTLLEYIQENFAQVALTDSFCKLPATDMEVYRELVDVVGASAAAGVVEQRRKRRKVA